MKQGDNLYRILDANLNRAKEGLRVCEDVCRYVWDEKALTRQLKDLRHALTAVVEPLGLKQALASRNIGADVGRATNPSESLRKDISAIFWANAQRVKESLRVLEEVAKLKSPGVAVALKRLRYQFYAIEQKALKCL